MPTRLQAVIFDLGGTLLHYRDRDQDTFRDVTQRGLAALCERLIQLGYRLPPVPDLTALLGQHIRQAYIESMQALRGGSIEQPIRAALVEAGLTLGDDEWAAVRHTFYAATDAIVSPRTGMRPTLEALRAQGYRLALISNTFWATDLHDRHLAEHNLLDLLPERIYSSDSPYVKPHPGIFRAMIDRLGIAPAQAVYVGDRASVDIAGAQGAGLRAVLIRVPYRDEDLGTTIPDAIIDELPDLVPTLERLDRGDGSG
jgi:putative hydrolase of the HAD superfamily